MNGLLSDLGRTPGVLAACFFGREGGFSEHKGQKELPREKVERAFDLQRQLRNVDKIFARVFGRGSSGTPARKKQARPPRHTGKH